MKKAVALVFIAIVAAGIIHYFYSEEHCPVCFPSAEGGFNPIPHHHANTSTCLCFLSAVLCPESDDWTGASDFLIKLSPAGDNHLRTSLGADIAHPPKSFPV